MSTQNDDLFRESCRKINIQSLLQSAQIEHSKAHKSRLLQNLMLYTTDCAVGEMMIQSMPLKDRHSVW
jgi:hypothetical protein